MFNCFLASSLCSMMQKHSDFWSFICIFPSSLTSLYSVQSLSYVWLFATPWTVGCQASLSITNSWSLLKLMSIESGMPSNHLILCRPLLFPPSIFPSIRVFTNESVLRSGSQSIGVPASASIFLMNIQDWFSFRIDSFYLLLSKGLLRVFSSTTVKKHQFFSAQLSFWTDSHICTWLLENHSFDCMVQAIVPF